MLICLVSLFTTSCVQGDFFDDYYYDTEWSLPRNKKGKDIFNPQVIPEDVANRILAEVWANTQDFAANQGECLACALYNYSVAKNMNKTRYQMRKYVGKKKYGEDWQYPYFCAVTQGGGVYLSDSQVNEVIYEAVGAINHTSSMDDLKPKFLVNFKNYSNDVIIEVNGNHYGVLQRVWQDHDNWSVWHIFIKDQMGDERIFDFSSITGVWY